MTPVPPHGVTEPGCVPHRSNAAGRPTKVVRVAAVERRGRFVGTLQGAPLVFHAVTQPAYRGVFREARA